MKLQHFLLMCFSICSFHSHFELAAITKEDVRIEPYKGNQSSKREGTVAICALFKNEAPFLREWIEYHLMIGVSHLYLYNNCSSDNYLAILKPYIKSGVVELFDVSDQPLLISHRLFLSECEKETSC